MGLEGLDVGGKLDDIGFEVLLLLEYLPLEINNVDPHMNQLSLELQHLPLEKGRLLLVLGDEVSDAGLAYGGTWCCWHTG